MSNLPLALSEQESHRLHSQGEVTVTGAGCWVFVQGIVFCDSSNINYLVVILGMFVWLPSDSRIGRFYHEQLPSNYRCGLS